MIKGAGNEVQLHLGKLRDIGKSTTYVSNKHIHCLCVDIDTPPTFHDQWLLMADIPLKLASITRYQPGTAIPK